MLVGVVIGYTVELHKIHKILIVMYVPFCVFCLILLLCVLFVCECVPDNCHRDIGALFYYPN
jgi:hypothetical protein